MKLIKRMANDANNGLHTRHASKKEQAATIADDELINVINATSKILMEFHDAVRSEMLLAQDQRKNSD